ncbi:MAG: T9SS type A sorting domain-containing protein [Bacteroidetes bacterium]|jgi:hypothetical protein|nr:T9SS type A sorting domain-containing protein [Bacteroidota bacterium]
MKRTATAVLTLLVVAAWCAVPAFAQPEFFDTNWELSDAEGNLPSYIGTSYGARGMAYGMVDDGSGTMVERVFVSTNQGGTFRVEVLDATDGTNLGTLDGTGISGGTRTLNDVDVSADGIIIACNLAINANFKCYRWDSVTATPSTIIDYTPGDGNSDGETDRVGSLISVVGSASDNSLTVHTAGVSNSENVYRFTTTDNGASFSAGVVTAGPQSTGNVEGIDPTGPGSSSFYLNPAGKAPTLYDASGTDQGAVQGASNFTTSVRYFEVGGNAYIALHNWGSGGGGFNADVIEVTGGPGSAVPYGSTPTLGSNGNVQANGDLDVRVNNDGTATIFVMSTNNGIGSYTTSQAPLPVELAGFEADRSGDNVVLRWQTLSETNNAGFDIERSIDGGAFAKVGFESGQGTTTETTSYQFVDARLPYGVSEVSYRLRQVDVDGDETLSDAQRVTLTPTEVSLIGSVPNPVASNQAEIRYELPEATNVRLSVYDLLGRQIATLVDGEQQAKQHVVPFDASTLASGTYLIRLETDRGATTSKMTIAR